MAIVMRIMTKTKTKVFDLGKVREESGGRPALSSSCISTWLDRSNHISTSLEKLLASDLFCVMLVSDLAQYPYW